MIWHHQDDDVPGPDASIELQIQNLPGEDRPVLVQQFRIDRTHSNAFERWKEIGSPQVPTPEQMTELERASDLSLYASPAWHQPESGSVRLPLILPRQGVSLLVVEPAQ